MAEPSGPLSFESWRDTVRPLLAAGTRPDRLSSPPGPNAESSDAASEGGATAAGGAERGTLRFPRPMMALLENLACFRHESRWELMYRLCWRALFENPRLLEDAADTDVAHANSMDRAVRRDLHKMHAFVRFREAIARGGEASGYFAWFEPQHEILRQGARFFARRFPNMRWTIATPDGAAVWDLNSLQFVPAQAYRERPRQDAHEDLWRTYYRSICNVARLNPVAMQREMPQRYWRNLPEAADIAPLLREGQARFAARRQQGDHERFSAAKAVQRSLQSLPPTPGGLQACRACDLWKQATQAVAGRGSERAGIMVVGEQPGDEEDLRGVPFVGPAGKVLHEALAAAGLRADELFVTNAVKHFKWEPRGRRRLHKRPGAGEIRACNIWLQAEIEDVKPRVIVALGATALSALCGLTESIETATRMELHHPNGTRILATYHPAAILRAPDGRGETLRAALIRTLQLAAEFAAARRDS